MYIESEEAVVIAEDSEIGSVVSKMHADKWTLRGSSTTGESGLRMVFTRTHKPPESKPK